MLLRRPNPPQPLHCACSNPYTAGVRGTSVFIGCFLALQLALPLSYYTCNDDKNDERFAWRMFSPVRYTQCATQFTVDGERVRLTKTFHESWAKIADRGRKVVIRRMAQRLCDDNEGKQVRVRLECRELNGRRSVSGGQWDFCSTGAW